MKWILIVSYIPINQISISFQADRDGREVDELAAERPLAALVGHVADLGDVEQQLQRGGGGGGRRRGDVAGRRQPGGGPLDHVGQAHQRVGGEGVQEAAATGTGFNIA